MLENIQLIRFKKFLDTEIKLVPFTILMGENSSGKTTVLQAINLALSILSKNTFIKWEDSKAQIRDRGVGLSVLPGIGISDFRDLYYSKISRQTASKKISDGTIGASIFLTDSSESVYRLQVSSLFGSFNVKCISLPDDFKDIPSLQDYAPLYISGFVGLQTVEERAFPMAIQNRLETGHVSTIIRNLLLDTKEKRPDKYNELADILREKFSFNLKEASFNENSDIYVNSAYVENVENRNVSFDFNSSGSGFMQVLQILTPIYRYCPEYSKIVLLDEPDAHLHPNLQVALADALHEIQRKLGIQIIISTHSTSIIKKSDPSEIVPISSGIKIAKPLSTEKDVDESILNTIDSYSLGKTVLSKKILFCEDANTSVLEEFDRILGTGVFSGKNTIPVLSGRGKDDKLPFYINQVFDKFSLKDIEIIYIRDSDGLNETWRLRIDEFANKSKIRVHILQRYEIENYLLDAKVIRNCLSIININKGIPDTKEIESKIKTLLIDTIRLRKYSYEDTLEDSIFKSSLLLSLDQYRNQATVKSECKDIVNSYEKIDSYEELLKIGMGKEVLKGLFTWINDELKLKISKKDLIKSFKQEEIPNELVLLLEGLKSNVV